MTTKTIMAFLVVAALLLSGCATTQAPPQNQAPSAPGQGGQPQNQSANGTPAAPPANATAPSCDTYCRGLPHIQCVGTWNISGTYPGCVCGFDCETQPQQNASPGPDEPLATPTNLSIKEMVRAGLEGQKSDFYKSNSGVYTEKTYTWYREGTGGILGGGLAPSDDVKFDGNIIASIQAAGFTVFESDSGGIDKAYGLAVFNETHTLLDGYTGSDTFDMSFFPSVIDKNLRDCYVYTKDFNVDSHGGWLLTYYFKCSRAVDK